MTEEEAAESAARTEHSRSFLERESQRFIAAAWREDPDRAFFVLRDGEAELHRELARTQLRCIVSDCVSPAITTVARKHQRQGFRHFRAGQHSPEGFNHLQGKAVIADWLRNMPGDLHVELEQSVDTQRRRRARVADVMATEPRTGHRTAFEVQYASISVDEWRERTADYSAAGIGVVWLFGHAGVHMRARRGVATAASSMQVGSVHAAASTLDGLPALWLNPAAGLLAVATTLRDDLLVQREAGKAQLTAFPLDEVVLREGRLVSDRFVMMAARERELAERAEADRQRNEALAQWRAELKAKRLEEWQRARMKTEVLMKDRKVKPKRDAIHSMSRIFDSRAQISEAGQEPKPTLTRLQRGLPAEGTAFASLLDRIARRFCDVTTYTKREVMWHLWRAVAENPRSPLAPRCVDCGQVLGAEDERAGSPRHRTRCGERSPYEVRTGHSYQARHTASGSLADLLKQVRREGGSGAVQPLYE